MRKLILAGLTAAIVVAFAAPALAWHITQPFATRTCSAVKVAVQVPDEEWFTGSATLTAGGQSATTSTPGPLTVTVPLAASAPAGSLKGTVTWSDSNEVESFTVSYGAAAENCIPKPKQGSAGLHTTCDSVTFNFDGADQGISQYAKVDGKVKKPASLNGSVTFKNLTPGRHPVEYGSGKNVQRGAFIAEDCHPTDDDKGEDFAGTSTSTERDTPTGPSTPTVTATPGQLPFTGPRDWLAPLGFALLGVGVLLRRLARLN